MSMPQNQIQMQMSQAWNDFVQQMEKSIDLLEENINEANRRAKTLQKMAGYKAFNKRIAKHRQEIKRLEQARNKQFPKPKGWWELQRDAKAVLLKDFRALRLKVALNDITKQEKKKLISDFQQKDYYAIKQ